MATKMSSEQKHDDSSSRRVGKDDMKEQASLSKKGGGVSEDAPVDSGSSLVGGTIAAVQGALDKGLHMLPESLQTRAIGLEEQAKGLIDKAAEMAKPVVEKYQKEGVIAAAKTAGSLGAGAVSSASASASASAAGAATNLKASASGAASNIKASASGAAGNLKASATGAASNLQARAGAAGSSLASTAAALQTKATGVAAGIKQKIMPGDASAAADQKPKKRGRRRRGGRGHGNRKLKTRQLTLAPAETIADTLGERAKELKEVVVEAPPKSGAGSSDAGLISGIKGRVAGATAGISASASGLVASAQSTVSGLVSDAQGKLAAVSDSVKGTLSRDSKGDSGKSLDRKPSLQRKEELPSLGTPQTPEDGSVRRLPDGKLAVNPGDQSSLLDKAKFAVGGVRDYVADKLDNLSMNADDTQPLDKEDRSALRRAGDQLHEMKQSIKK